MDRNDGCVNGVLDSLSQAVLPVTISTARRRACRGITAAKH